MKTWHAIALIVAIWAGIYLTHLGARELRGEEARRIVPALEMRETGDWIVPRIAGEVYSNKPPLINWLIAASFAATGVESEFTARLPSVIALLSLGLVGFFALRDRLENHGAASVVVALFTAIAMIDKCRSVEIESVYIALFGIAAFLWIRLWSGGASPWLTWILPGLFLGLGWLAKGPTHLLFWGLFVIFTLRSAGRLRDLLHPAHYAGLAVMAAVFLPWMVANVQAVGSSEESVGNWVEQIAVRADFSEVDWDDWALRPLEILANFLPWTVALLYAFWCLRGTGRLAGGGDRWDAVTRGALLACAASGVLFCLLPGGLPRYLMPLFPLAALATVDCFRRVEEGKQEAYDTFARKFLIGLMVVLVVGATVATIVANRRSFDPAIPSIAAGLLLLGGVAFTFFRRKRWPGFIIATGLAFAAGFPAFFGAMHPFQEDKFRHVAEEIRSIAGEEGKVVIYADEIWRQAYTQHLRLFVYLRPRFEAFGESGRLPNDTAILVGRSDATRKLHRMAKRHFEVTGTRTIRAGEGDREMLVLSLRPLRKSR